MQFIKPSVEIITEPDLFKRIEIGARNCYTDAVDVLTDAGWKNISEITNDDRVLTYNKDTNTLQYEPSNMVKKWYEGDIIYSSHSRIAFEVTLGHRMFVSNICKRDYCFVKASELLGTYGSHNRHWRVPVYFNKSCTTNDDYNELLHHSSAINIGRGRHKIQTIDVRVSDELLFLLGSYIAEGSVYDGRGHGSGSRISIYQSDGAYLDMICSSLDTLGWKYHISADPRKPQIKQVMFGNAVMLDALTDWCGRGSKNVHLPTWFRLLSQRQMRILLESIYLGDGSHNTTRTEQYLSSSKRLLDEVQELFVLLGRSASVHYPGEHHYNNKWGGSSGHVEERMRDSYILQRKHLHKRQYKGWVYCPSTEAGVVCIRQNGIPMWCGNCYKSEDKITEDSARKMISALMKRGHESPLEHSNIVVYFNDIAYNLFDDLLAAYTSVTGIPHYIRTSLEKSPMYLCAGNLRAWRSLVKLYPGHALFYQLFGDHPAFADLELKPTARIPGVECGVYTGLVKDPQMNIITARFICDRGVSHELVRHRALSFSQESTRYVNYKAGLILIEPWWWPRQETSDTQLIRSSCQVAEDVYCSLIASGASPQKARCVLPNMLKTEVVATGTVEQWKKLVLPLRLSKAAHPDIRRLMELFCQQLSWNPDDFRKE